MKFQEKTKSKISLIRKNWSNSLLGNACVRVADDFDGSDLISTYTCIKIDGKQIPFECSMITFDIDLDKSDRRYVRSKPNRKGQLTLCHREIRFAIKIHYPELLPYLTYFTASRNTGLSLVMMVAPFRFDSDLRCNMALAVQKRIGSMLKAIGIGVDESAYGLKRDIPNPYRHDLRRYRNQRKRHTARYVTRKDGNGNPIIHVLTALLDITGQYKAVWDEAKNRHPDRFLYPDARIEMKLAKFYVGESEFKFTEKFHSQKELAERLEVSIRTARKLIHQGGVQCLLIETLLDGYLVTRIKIESLWKRAKSLLKGSFKDWKMPLASHVEDGQRNEYIWRCAVILKFMGFQKFKAIQTVQELCKTVPGYSESKNMRRIKELVTSIFKNQPLEEKLRRKHLGHIEGLESAIAAVGTSLRNVLSGTGGDEKEEKTEKLKPRFLGSVTESDFQNLRSEPLIFGVNSDGREFERQADPDQKCLVKHIHENFLKGLIDPLIHRNSHAYVIGKSNHSFEAAKAAFEEKHEDFIKFDIQSFFPSINHDILKSKLCSIMDESKASAIMRTVTAPTRKDGKIIPRPVGIPVGSSFSNKLSNLYLTEFDNWLEAEGYDFVRFSDDVYVYGSDLFELERFWGRIQNWLWDKLRLRVNFDKVIFSWKGE